MSNQSPATAPLTVALCVIGLAGVLQMSVGCQDGGAGGFVEYSQTEEAPAATREADQPSDADASRADLGSSDSDLVDSDAVADADDPVQQTSPALPVSQAANEAVDATTDETAASADSDETASDVTEASPVSARSEAMAEMMRQRAATLAAYGGEPVATDPALVDQATSETQTPAEPREIKLLIEDKRLRTEGDNGALRVSYDDIDLLKILNMEPVPVDAVNHFPDWLNELDGQRIRIRGFMYPTFQATGLTAFTMARDNGICCFVRQPKIYDIIGIRLADGEETDYIEGKPFDVEGIFHIVPEADETELYQLYRIEDGRVLH